MVAAAYTLFVASLERRMAALDLRTPDAFTGFVLTGKLTLPALQSTFAQLPEGVTELMCHPGYYDQDLQNAPTMLKRKREIEQKAVADSIWREWLSERGIRLTSFRTLASASAA